MEKIDILMWVIGIGFTFNFALMIAMWNNLNAKIDGINNSLGAKIDKLDEKLTDFGVSISLHNGMREEIRGIQTEMKDFHGRLCAIEERNKK